MKYNITQTTLTPELKASIYEAFAKHAIDSVGFDGLAGEPIAFEIIENDVSLGIVVCQLFWGNLHIYFGAICISSIYSQIKSIVGAA